MRPYTLKIPAGSSEEIACNGNYIRVATATEELTVESPDRNETVTLAEGDDARLGDFVRLRFSHESGAEQTVKVYIGKDTQISSSRVGGALTVSPTRTGGATHTVATVTNASGQLVAANSARLYLLIQNKSITGTIYVNLNGDAATVDAGIEIPPGGAYESSAAWVSTAAITAIGSIASNAEVLVVEGV